MLQASFVAAYVGLDNFLGCGVRALLRLQYAWSSATGSKGPAGPARGGDRDGAGRPWSSRTVAGDVQGVTTPAAPVRAGCGRHLCRVRGPAGGHGSSSGSPRPPHRHWTLRSDHGSWPGPWPSGGDQVSPVKRIRRGRPGRASRGPTSVLVNDDDLRTLRQRSGWIRISTATLACAASASSRRPCPRPVLGRRLGHVPGRGTACAGVHPAGAGRPDQGPVGDVSVLLNSAPDRCQRCAAVLHDPGWRQTGLTLTARSLPTTPAQQARGRAPGADVQLAYAQAFIGVALSDEDLALLARPA